MDQAEDEGMNEFFRDAAYFATRCARAISDDMGRDAVLDAVLHFAFSAERMAKGVLWDVDPRFTLEDGGDDNSIAVLYSGSTIEAYRNGAEKQKRKEPNRNTVTFRDAVLKSKLFSQASHDHAGALLKLSEFRGVVVHRQLSQIDIADASRFLRRHFFPIINAFVKERALNGALFFGERDTDLRKLSRHEAMSGEMEKLIVDHEAIWEQRKGDTAFIKDADRRTFRAEKDVKNGQYFHLLCQCPACVNHAVLRVEVEWESEGRGGDAWPSGEYIAGLHCEYCDLELDDFEQFDFFGLNKVLEESRY